MKWRCMHLILIHGRETCDCLSACLNAHYFRWNISEGSTDIHRDQSNMSTSFGKINSKFVSSFSHYF